MIATQIIIMNWLLPSCYLSHYGDTDAPRISHISVEAVFFETHIAAIIQIIIMRNINRITRLLAITNVGQTTLQSISPHPPFSINLSEYACNTIPIHRTTLNPKIFGVLTSIGGFYRGVSTGDGGCTCTRYIAVRLLIYFAFPTGLMRPAIWPLARMKHWSLMRTWSMRA